MSCWTQKLSERNLITPPQWLPNNIQYEVITGSRAYGTYNEDSDYDICGFVIPKKELVFPHCQPGYIYNFGQQVQEFDGYKQETVDNSNKKKYDINIYNIVRYFQLCMENNPNMIDTLFVSDECITQSTQVSEMVRDKRKLFLHKGCWHKFKGYSYAQARQAGLRDKVGKRKELVDQYGFDTKAASHCVRLINEVEMILVEGDLDLLRNHEHVKAIKRGDIPKEDVQRWFSEKELALEKLYNESKLPWGPDDPKIRQLLIDCLEHHYGSLEAAYTKPSAEKRLCSVVFDSVDDDREFIGADGETRDNFIEKIGKENVLNVQFFNEVRQLMIYYWGQ